MIREYSLMLALAFASRSFICTAQPCENWSLSITTDVNPGQTSWQILDAGSSQIMASGGGYTNYGTLTLAVCLPANGTYNLVMHDTGGDGIPGGGWVLRDAQGRRVLDNAGNGGSFTTSCIPPEPFYSTVGIDKLLDTRCDVESWLISSVIVCAENPLVSAQWLVGDQTDDGYQFWFFDPVGLYSRKIFRNHATSGGQGPVDAVRACKLSLNSITTDPLPLGTLLNVRVRSRVNGSYSPWGAACRFRMDAVAAQCPATRLVDYAGPLLSCGVFGRHVNGTDRLYARPVVREINGGTQVADHYQFEFSLPSENYTHVATNTSAWVVLAPWTSNPLLCGAVTYNVRVRASFNGGNSWCPWGSPCTVQVINDPPSPCNPGGANIQGDLSRAMLSSGQEVIHLWPNPNNGDQLFIAIDDPGEEVGTVTIEITDVFGKRVMSIAAMNASTQRIALQRALADGLYVVSITTTDKSGRAGERMFIERLVIAK